MTSHNHLKFIGGVIRITALMAGLVCGAFCLLAFYLSYELIHVKAQCGMPVVAGYIGFIISPVVTLIGLLFIYGFYQGGMQVQAGQRAAIQGMMGFAGLYLTLFLVGVYFLKPIFPGTWFLRVSSIYAVFFTYALGQLVRVSQGSDSQSTQNQLT